MQKLLLSWLNGRTRYKLIFLSPLVRKGVPSQTTASLIDVFQPLPELKDRGEWMRGSINSFPLPKNSSSSSSSWLELEERSGYAWLVSHVTSVWRKNQFHNIKVTTKLLTREAMHSDLTEACMGGTGTRRPYVLLKKGPKRRTYPSTSSSNNLQKL